MLIRKDWSPIFDPIGGCGSTRERAAAARQRRHRPRWSGYYVCAPLPPKLTAGLLQHCAQDDKFFFAQRNYTFATNCTLCPHFFTLCPDPPILCPDPPILCPAFYVLLQLRGSRAVETHWFRWKEIDVLFTIAVTLLPRRTQPMADNYRGSQSRSWESDSRTGGGPIYFTRPFQVPDTRTARGQHDPAARQSRVRIPATD